MSDDEETRFRGRLSKRHGGPCRQRDERRRHKEGAAVETVVPTLMRSAHELDENGFHVHRNTKLIHSGLNAQRSSARYLRTSRVIARCQGSSVGTGFDWV